MTEESLEVIEIAPTSGWRALDLREIWQYRELLQILTWRDVKVRYRQTLLGVIWVVAQPLMTMIIFTLLFNRVAKISADHGLPYSLFVMAALVPWTFFSTAVTGSGNSLIGSAHLISKVYFPRMIIPASSVLAGLVDMAVTLGLVLVMYVWYSVPLSWSLLIVPLPVVVTAVLAFGFGLWLSALNVEYRDVRVVIPFLLQIWMYATPVVYPLKALPLKYHWIVRVNPVTGIVDAFRACLLGQPLPWASLGYAAVFGLVVMITGAFYFRRVERLFADVL
jgi:homopolymeric O-antigen transport system permease protein